MKDRAKQSSSHPMRGEKWCNMGKTHDLDDRDVHGVSV
jgi:hypothetical protein